MAKTGYAAEQSRAHDLCLFCHKFIEWKDAFSMANVMF